MSEPGENAIRIDWRLEEGEKEEKRMGKRRTEIWGEEGEYATEGRNIKAVSELGWDRGWGKNSMEQGSKLGVGCLGEQCEPEEGGGAFKANRLSLKTLSPNYGCI